MLVEVALALASALARSDPAGPCNIDLLKQTSHGNCIYGKTYGCVDPNTMFVKNCSGLFRCGAAVAGKSAELTCKSTDFARDECILDSGLIDFD